MNTAPRTRPPSRPLAALVVWGVLAALGALAWSESTVTAHNVVVETSPEAGKTTSDSPVQIRVVTNDELLDLGGTGSGFAIVVRDSDNLYFGDGCVSIGSTDLATTADLGEAGEYLVTYQFVSADGHSLSDSFSFTFAPRATHTPATGHPDPPRCGEPAPSDEPPTDESRAPEDAVAQPTDEDFVARDGGESGIMTAAIAGVLVVLSVTLVVWLVRRQSRG